MRLVFRQGLFTGIARELFKCGRFWFAPSCHATRPCVIGRRRVQTPAPFSPCGSVPRTARETESTCTEQPCAAWLGKKFTISRRYTGSRGGGIRRDRIRTARHPPLWAGPICRVRWIYWPAVKAGLFTKARLLLRLLRAVMARLAKRLQGPVEKLVRVAAMPVDMVSDGCRDGLASQKVEAAKRLMCELPEPPPLPCPRVIEPREP